MDQMLPVQGVYQISVNGNKILKCRKHRGLGCVGLICHTSRKFDKDDDDL
jgi:hypothetical protein